MTQNMDTEFHSQEMQNENGINKSWESKGPTHTQCPVTPPENKGSFMRGFLRDNDGLHNVS